MVKVGDDIHSAVNNESAIDVLVDFDAVNAVALQQYPGLLQQWFPLGKLERDEFKIGDIYGTQGKSLEINIKTGLFHDWNPTGISGKDPIALYQALNPSLDMREAAIALCAEMGITPPAQSKAKTKARQAKQKQLTEQDEALKQEAAQEWRQILPPPSSNKPHFGDVRYGDPTLQHCYKNEDGRVIGYICRYQDKAKQRKVFKQWTYRTDGVRERWMSSCGFDKPRPLYNLDAISAAQLDNAVLIVEGEKAADAAIELSVLVTTWQGGSSAIQATDWEPLRDRPVILCPDHDEAGLQAMSQLADKLKPIARSISVISPKAMNGKPDKWDIADYAWEPGELQRWIKEHAKDINNELLPSHDPKNMEGITYDWAFADTVRDKWISQGTRHKHLFEFCSEEVCFNRTFTANAMLVMKYHPRIATCFMFDVFRARVMMCEEPPWHNVAESGPFKAHALEAHDITELNFWLQQFGFNFHNRRVEEVLVAAAKRNTINYPKEYMKRHYEDNWDGVSRLDTWLKDYLKCDTQPDLYLKEVGAKWIIAAVSRIYEPGTKFDHVPILEGTQGVGKSTTIRALSTFGDPGDQEDFFSDSDISFQGTRDDDAKTAGKIFVELSEMSTYKVSDVERIKHYVSKTHDEQRLLYNNYSVKVPRMFVLVGSKNAIGPYLKDASGNRRFWPIEVGSSMRFEHVDDLTRDAPQLWAEAIQRYKQGEKLYLSEEAQKLALFEQQERTIKDAIEAQVLKIAKDVELETQSKGFDTDKVLQIAKKQIDTERRDITPDRIQAILSRGGYEWVQKGQYGRSHRCKGWHRKDKKKRIAQIEQQAANYIGSLGDEDEKAAFGDTSRKGVEDAF